MRIGRVLIAVVLVAFFTTAAQVASAPFGGMPYN
ncbi:hypothetical protein C8E97_6066 [Saccharothrix australiensis]|uniref:Uncharacterized protein n=1 Tax=Saccharothrix australiensis TaxID=2072 RepID=A0A495W892_9PSEU|nr:hypothetical protein C8E97_6066 [Saccharothrix australiensis]